MSSEDVFEEDFSEELITELEREYGNSNVENVNVVNEKVVNFEKSLEESSKETNNVNVNKTIASTSDTKLFQLPLTRIRNIMKLDPDLHIASNEAVFLVTRATELFIESLALESYNFTLEAKKKTIQKRDVDLAIDAVDSLMFLDGAMTF
ncbi:hypothetical protein DOY81_005526 [Sarcophaga bullata]|nr:hypothetical protein DOY81_005526 [Sarcophaga bullata]